MLFPNLSNSRHKISTVDGETLEVVEFHDAVVIHDKDGDVAWVSKDDLPKFIGKLAEIAGQHIEGKVE